MLNCGLAQEVEFRESVPVSTLDTSKRQKRKVTHKVKKPEKKLRFSSLISLYTLSFSRDSPKKAFLLLEEAPENFPGMESATHTFLFGHGIVQGSPPS